MRKSKNVRRISFRGTPKVLARKAQLEPAGSQPGDELDSSVLARLGSGSKDGQVRGRSGDLRGVQGTGRVVDLWGYRASRPRIENGNRPTDIRHDGPIEQGVIDVRYNKSNYVVTWQFPGVSDAQEMHEITQKMFVDQAGDGPKARTIKYSALVQTCIVRSFWMDADIDTIFRMAADTMVLKNILNLQQYHIWRQFNEVMIEAVDYLTENPDHPRPMPLEKYLRLFQAGHLDRDEASYKLF